ncbi:MobF family relaxase [Flavivirga aquimarina]|uniref:MobF family relaxase n=1 Tax=Flavivirga aquimarina TaxID=2027862 RepID=A0ABT8WAY6_9FLAO|nr:MobF family relaxase [Flavivirga aquimarina]MDO5970300.1 MobF family relaxase [Flavivirga aquimarina]
MLRITISHSSEAATLYFNEGLSKEGNYYLDEKISTCWEGKASAFLGLKGKEVNKKGFSNLAKNIRPESNNERLTVRNAEQRRAGYDFTINVPKSVSVTEFFTKDERIKEAILSANQEMMKAIEASAQTQANIGNERHYEHTGNLIYSPFLHFKSRPTPIEKNGKTIYASDPMIHIHNFVMNVTHNKSKDRFQALEIGNIWRDAEYYQEVFHSNLSHKLNKLGYQIERTHDRYEIKGISHLNDRFSNRIKHINKIAKEKKITDPKKLSELGAKTRLSKSKTLNEKELHQNWQERLTKTEIKNVQNIKGKHKNAPRPISAKEAIDRSLEHFFERNSTAPEKRVLAHALTLGYGHLLPQDVQKELDRRSNILRSEDKNTISHITTKEMIRAENRMIELATSGKGKFPALNPNYKPKADFLNDQQRKAIKDILISNDQVSILKGAAESGKTTLLKEVASGVREAKKSLFAAAPSTQAVNVLKQKGFKAGTIAALLHNPKLQENLKNAVLIVDEAGMVGVKAKSEILSLAQKHKTRIILSGDTYQHGPPGQYGDALRILQDKAKLKTVTVNKVIRQKPEGYRKAVEQLAKGKTLEGYKALDKLGAIKEITDYEKRMDAIADDYVASVTKKRSALIISPTNAEGEILSDIVRERLKSKGCIQGKDRSFETLKNLSFTEAQRKDTANYQEGQVIRFTKNQRGGFKAGGHYEVLKRNNQDGVTVLNLVTKQIHKLPHEQPEYFQIYWRHETPLAKGDLIKLTNNSKTLENSKIANGTRFNITGFTKTGDIKLSNGKTLSKDIHHIKHAYVETSHATQGKDAMDVIISQSEALSPADNREQFYVSVSRGTHAVKVYTPDKFQLKQNISRSGEHMTAREVADNDRRRLLQQQRRTHHRTLNEKLKEHGRNRQREQSPARRVLKSQGFNRDR